MKYISKTHLIILVIIVIVLGALLLLGEKFSNKNPSLDNENVSLLQANI